MKPIEPGCKAMIIQSVDFPHMIGNVILVIDYFGNFSGHAWVTNDFTGGSNLWFEKCLMRIDEDENLLLENHDKELVHD